MNEADKLNRINDLELENSQLKEVLPQAFAALEMLAKGVVDFYNDTGDPRNIDDQYFKMAERSLEWLKQFRSKEKNEHLDVS